MNNKLWYDKLGFMRLQWSMKSVAFMRHAECYLIGTEQKQRFPRSTVPHYSKNTFPSVNSVKTQLSSFETWQVCGMVTCWRWYPVKMVRRYDTCLVMDILFLLSPFKGIRCIYFKVNWISHYCVTIYSVDGFLYLNYDEYIFKHSML